MSKRTGNLKDYAAQRADRDPDFAKELQENLDFLQGERDAALLTVADQAEELIHLRRGIAVFRDAHLAAIAVRPAAAKAPIEAWLETDRQRERARIEQEDWQRAEQTRMPTVRDWSDQ